MGAISTHDLILLGLVSVGGSIVAIGVLSMLLSFFIALGSPPAKRSAWTVGIAYLVAALGGVFADLQGYELAVPLILLPGALLVFFYWWWSFRRGWIEHNEDLPVDGSVEDDDWRVGLFRLLLAVFVAVSVAAARYFARTML
jgi:hypothetical protein